MKVTKLKQGVYKVTDSQGVWIARGGAGTNNGKWTANECDKLEDCTTENNWAVEFKTFKQLKQFAQNN
jgi:hypothetical protein